MMGVFSARRRIQLTRMAGRIRLAGAFLGLRTWASSPSSEKAGLTSGRRSWVCQEALERGFGDSLSEAATMAA